jgi:hypothetical protein
MGLRRNYNVEINGKLISLAYFHDGESCEAMKALKKLEEIRLQGKKFNSIGELNQWIEVNASSGYIQFIWY